VDTSKGLSATLTGSLLLLLLLLLLLCCCCPQVGAIDTCLREPQGRAKCATVQAPFEEQ
jgi:hypothetical protein